MRQGLSEEEFSEWLIKLGNGNGELPASENDEIDLPTGCISDVLQRLHGVETVYSIVDDIEFEDGEDGCNYPTEFLNSLAPSGMPPHKLNLKTDAIVMLLRNLDVNRGLYNGIRLIVKRLHNYTVDCEVTTGSNKGSRTLIARISLLPSDTFLPFKVRRRQFPIRLSFAMPINKLQ
ncbi:unnamed protein product [Rotaria magnacalcarata]|nr:unnamed protein product [Rotaria magnacalcarata]CAF4082139.1 unnamed protein product [Rotaria magnacalcarata]CAF4186147.1 unnamed protein product [Rotaria magnacalcarata]CAF4693507.1 unnamed protein product [Rotaria magnacalcarata]